MLASTDHHITPRAALEGLGPSRRQRSVFLPALAPFPPESWPLTGLLPVLDINGTLTAALAARQAFQSAPPIAGVFACDPFLRFADLVSVLRRAGVTEVVNFPTLQFFGGETSAALAAVGYRAETEFRLLQRLAEQGFSPIACATGRRSTDLALSMGLRRILLHPGLISPPDPQRWWGELAGHVAIEGGEALAWQDQVSKPRRRIRL